MSRNLRVATVPGRTPTETGGFVIVCSCSHHLDGEQLDRAMLELGARGNAWTRIASWGPGLDHPVWPGHREGEYLRVRVYQRR